MITVIPRKITATSVNGVAVANDGSITLPVDSTPTSNSTNLVTSGGVKTELDALTTGLAGKQNTLTFDSTPTSGSTNPVTSGGVYAALANGQNTPVAFGTCASAAAEQNKVVTVSDSNWQLKVGSIVGVKFSNSNTYSATAQNPCTLNVNSSGAKAVYYGTGVYTGDNPSILGYNNRTNFYMYDGTYWVWLNTSQQDGNSFPSAYCTTGASTSAKVATCTNFTLAANSYVHILIASANTYDGAITLNINSTGAKPVYINGSASSSSNKTLPAGTYIIYYNGTNYYFRTDGMLPGSIVKVNGHTVGKDVPSDAVFTDTTYESKSAASGGTAVSLVTTGEKYTWNNKTDKVSGATSGNFAGLDANGNLTDSGSKASDFLTSHQDISGKVDKNQGVANAGKALGIGNDGMVTPVPFSGTDFTGATASAAGTHGYVPAPAAGDQNKVLKGGGAWATIPETANEMVMSSSDSRTIKEAIDDLGDVVTEFYLIIRPTFWTNSAPYLYTWTDSRVHADSYIEVTVENSSVDATADYIEYYKTQAGDGIVFKPNKRPTADLELAVTITNAQMHAASSIDADTVVTDAINGASSVDGALTVLNSNINTMVGTHSTDIVALKNDLGIVENGDTATHTIAQGQYVIWHSALYTADAAITSGTTLAASGNDKNLTAVENGGLNSLYSNLIQYGVIKLQVETALTINANTESVISLTSIDNRIIPDKFISANILSDGGSFNNVDFLQISGFINSWGSQRIVIKNRDTASHTYNHLMINVYIKY